ncbi:MAG TPA: hypothetical protein VKI18_17625 [Albitalea sp.]|nr:hypothetical protein [Albitalea sp.]
MTSKFRFYVAVFATLLGLAGPAHADADELKARHAALTEQLAHSPFQRPLVLESTESAGDLKGEVYAVMDHPFATIGGALKQAGTWCDVLILHLNVKQCRVNGSMLAVVIGRKFDQPVSEAYKVEFNYKVAAQSADHLHVQLSADAGPLGTRNYRIGFEAVPLDAQHSFIRMSYSYGYGFAARMAMQGYLATIGSGKVGFSVVGRNADGTPVLIDNVRGVVERNTMRYYLAIDAYLDSLSTPAGEQVEKRLRDWFAATERYPKQLHEMERDEYMTMKRKEVKRQQEG